MAWAPTPQAFRQFLAWLDRGVDTGGAAYLEIRRRLVAYFDRKRCVSPDELADETLSRVVRRLADEGSIDNVEPAQYCYIVAKFVFLESKRRAQHVPIPDGLRAAEPDPTAAQKERLLACLDQCLCGLAEPERELILEYYLSDQREKIERRRAYAARLGISPNALAIRACRIRNKLEACLTACTDARHDFLKTPY